MSPPPALESKYTLIHEHKSYGSCDQKITLEFEAVTLDEVILSIEHFLKGVGFPIGSLVHEENEAEG